ncbi:hypothetical protein OIU78_022273 [Salix suchowensis]|nr:hypothetical protein OIU78_022273 [Salix suchowensis]
MGSEQKSNCAEVSFQFESSGCNGYCCFWTIQEEAYAGNNNKTDQQNMGGEYYSNYSPEDLKEGTDCEVKEEDELEEQDENEDDDKEVVVEKTLKPYPVFEHCKSHASQKEVRWNGNPVSKTYSGEDIYKQAIVCGEVIVVGAAVLVEVDKPDELPAIYFVEYMFETRNGSKMFHGRMMKWGI